MAIKYWFGFGVGSGRVVTVRLEGPLTYSLTWMAFMVGRCLA